MFDINSSNNSEFLQKSEDTFVCFEILYGAEPTEEEIIEARVRNFARQCR